MVKPQKHKLMPLIFSTYLTFNILVFNLINIILSYSSFLITFFVVSLGVGVGLGDTTHFVFAANAANNSASVFLAAEQLFLPQEQLFFFAVDAPAKDNVKVAVLFQVAVKDLKGLVLEANLVQFGRRNFFGVKVGHEGLTNCTRTCRRRTIKVVVVDYVANHGGAAHVHVDFQIHPPRPHERAVQLVGVVGGNDDDAARRLQDPVE